MEEKALITRIANNDSSAFNELICRYYASLVGFASSILKNQHVAEDIVQEMFAGMWEQRINLMNIKSIRNYLYVSIRNLAINHIRAEKRLKKRYEKINPEHNNMAAGEEITKLLMEAIERLPSRSALAMKLSLQGLSLDEIAAEMGVSLNTVRSTKAYALNKLRYEFGHNLHAATLLAAIG